jgi:hypothetical protein
VPACDGSGSVLPWATGWPARLSAAACRVLWPAGSECRWPGGARRRTDEAAQSGGEDMRLRSRRQNLVVWSSSAGLAGGYGAPMVTRHVRAGRIRRGIRTVVLFAAIGVMGLGRAVRTRPGGRLLVAGAVLTAAGIMVPSGVTVSCGMLVLIRGWPLSSACQSCIAALMEGRRAGRILPVSGLRRMGEPARPQRRGVRLSCRDEPEGGQPPAGIPGVVTGARLSGWGGGNRASGPGSGRGLGCTHEPGRVCWFSAGPAF